MKPRSFRKRKMILIVEDEPLIRQVLRRYLGIQGYQVVDCASGKEALRLTGEGAPDALIIDHHLPDMTGLEFYRIFQDQNGNVPAILTSAYELKREELKEAERLGVKGFLGKPFGYPHLRSLVKGLFRRPHFYLTKPRFFFKAPGTNLNPRHLAQEVFRKMFREGLDLGGHVHFHVEGHEDHIILLCSRHTLGKVIAKSPDCAAGECIKWEQSSFAKDDPAGILNELSQQINLVRVDAADYEMSWPTLADFLCWLNLSY